MAADPEPLLSIWTLYMMVMLSEECIKGQKILPNSPHIIGPKGEAEDSSRVRADGTPALDMSDFGMPYAIAK